MTPYELINLKYKEINDFFEINSLNKLNKDDIIKDILLRYIEDNILDFIVIDSSLTSGVYLIEDFYIGKTNNIFNRMSYHILDGYKYIRQGYLNKSKCDKIEQHINNSKIKVKMLSNKQNDEKKLIEKFCNKLPLTNIEFNPNKISNYENFKKESITQTIKSIDLDEIIPDFFDNQFEMEMEINKFRKFKVEIVENRFIVIIENKYKKSIGVYTCKNKFNFHFPNNKKIQKDINKYGKNSFTITFIKSNNEYKNNIIERIRYYESEEFDIYNRANK